MGSLVGQLVGASLRAVNYPESEKRIAKEMMMMMKWARQRTDAVQAPMNLRTGL